MVDLRNEFGEIIENIGEIILNHSYWDCECEHDYIHHVSESICEVCLHKADVQPNSRENEIILLGKRWKL